MSDNRQYFNILKKKQYISIINSKEYKITKFPNYSEDANGEVNATTYIWDALKVSFDGYITSNCLKPIIF